MPQVTDSVERLRGTGGELLGAVVNGVHAALPRPPIAKGAT
jgi:hypothetical protein